MGTVRMGTLMARRDVDLGTALCVFFCGGPERFNYIPKRDVPAGLRATARLLDNICQRINSGFYLPQPGLALDCRRALDRWLVFQRADRAEGRRGRWQIDETIVADLLDPVRCTAPGTPRPRDAQLWRALLAPLRDLARPRDSHR